MEQMSLFPEVDEKRVRKDVIKQLKLYRALKVQLESRKEREEKGLGELFPSIYKYDAGSNEQKVYELEKALSTLDNTERKIIEMKYIDTREYSDLEIFLELGLKKSAFYEKRRWAINQLATALGILEEH